MKKIYLCSKLASRNPSSNHQTPSRKQAKINAFCVEKYVLTKGSIFNMISPIIKKEK